MTKKKKTILLIHVLFSFLMAKCIVFFTKTMLFLKYDCFCPYEKGATIANNNTAKGKKNYSQQQPYQCVKGPFLCVCVVFRLCILFFELFCLFFFIFCCERTILMVQHSFPLFPPFAVFSFLSAEEMDSVAFTYSDST